MRAADRVVAELGPPSQTRAQSLPDAVIAEMVRKGWMAPPRIPFHGPPPRAGDTLVATARLGEQYEKEGHPYFASARYVHVHRSLWQAVEQCNLGLRPIP